MTSSSESGLPIANRVTMALVQEVEARWGVNPLYPSTPGDPFVPVILGAGQVGACVHPALTLIDVLKVLRARGVHAREQG
jgi:hypothetical protein